MKTLLLIIVTLLSIVPPAAVSQNNSEERTIVMNNTLETITVYWTVIDVLRTAYVKNEDQLIRNDEENYYKIRKHFNVLLQDSKKNLNINTIESYVYSVGSGQYINEYKTLFIYLFDQKHFISGSPDELMYILDKNDRIVYFEARNVFKGGDKQVFDRKLLKRFPVTKKFMKNHYKVTF